ncbi:MAG: aldo/keto reductase [Alkalispirochaeta sp.]
MNLTSTVTLHNGVEMPRFGLGVFKSEPGAETRDAVVSALQAGYRSIDTATFYENEQSVGEGLAASGVPRDQVFVTTKVWNTDQGYQRTLEVFEESMDYLQLETLDLYLIHWPMAETFIETWRALEKLYDDGRVRAIGVSNFEPHHLERLQRESGIVPVVNQVELHPYLQQNELRDYCREAGIAVEAWSPIARGQVVDDSVLQEIGAAHGKSPVHATIRWELQHGIITIPKSVKPHRIADNADVFDFELSAAEMARIDALDQGESGRLGPHPDTIGG